MSLTRVSGLVVCVAVLAGCAGAAAAEPEPEPPDTRTEQRNRDAGRRDPKDTNILEFKRDPAIWTVVVFLVLLLILRKFAWGPLAQALDRREQGIADHIAEAEQSNQQAKQLLAQYEQKLADSQDEVRGILEQARRDAEQLGREMLDEAKQETQTEHQRALQEIDAATANALKELAGQSAELAVELAGRIVRVQLKAEDHAQLIERAMTNFAERGPGNGR